MGKIEQKISLSLFNKLSEAINKQVKYIEELPTTVEQSDYVIELSKALGMMTAISYEASGLVSDISLMVKKNSIPEEEISDLFAKLNVKEIDKN